MTDHRDGDGWALELLIGRYRRELFWFLARFVGDRAAAEDAVQETFLRVHQFAAQFDAGRQFRPWVFSIAANWARDVLRSRCRRATVSLQAPLRSTDGKAGELADLIPAHCNNPGDRIEAAEVRERVQSVLGAMPRQLREILQLACFDGLPYNEIADALTIPLGTVKSRLHGAVAHFAGRWERKHGAAAGPRRAARSRRLSPKRPAPPLGQVLAAAV